MNPTFLGSHTGEGRYPVMGKPPRSGHNRDVVPLARGFLNHLDSGLRRITSDLPACGLSRMASSSINDVVFLMEYLG
ncbi:hypothetical protein Slit_2513 [Sideroxydans lithotrophicus ES-1]|uniref:Uncharacterized protein n=1 Tax=Sideroxydans lithotrophicus (strain ES-1) TaxID=580332 RepID=D5CN41_SIDLE|nr:hypothetical protein Slit_2513 [Sideroxydans lithotrophicus ES-1]